MFTYPTLQSLTTDTPSGLYRISHEAYHDGAGLSSSDLKNALVSYGYYAHKKEADEEPTPSMEFGRAFHMAILEPDLFRDTYRVAPDVDRRTKEGKAKYAEHMAELTGVRRSISPADWETVFTLASSVRRHPRWGDIKNLTAEIAAVTKRQDPETYQVDLIKCKPDMLGGAIVDFKTTLCAAPWEFNRAVTRFGYHISAAFYQDIVLWVTGEILPFIFVAVEKKPPYGVAFYTLDEQYLEEGRTLYKAALRRIATWKGMPDERRALHYGSSVQVLKPTSATLYKTKDLLDAVSRDV